MRVCRVQTELGPRFGVIEGDDVELVPGHGPLLVDPANSRSGRELVPLAKAVLLAPTVPSKIFAVGRNYAAHAKEMGFDLPSTPSVFIKPPTALLPHGGNVVLPPIDVSKEVQHEAELVVVIGRPTRNVDIADAFTSVYGYTIANDVSARDLQRTDTHVTRAKGFDTFCPIGPWIETDVDESARPVRCTVDGELRQNGSTEDMVFSVSRLVSFISQWSTLLPGDLILTGSPHGTGPLEPGNTVEIEIGGVGTLVHGVAVDAA
jgi:2-keto-4-pentenoate hydratase/2-oxohepta-3-ene-1,7-dioic acid hydratase in catechol pathway